MLQSFHALPLDSKIAELQRTLHEVGQKVVGLRLPGSDEKPWMTRALKEKARTVEKARRYHQDRRESASEKRRYVKAKASFDAEAERSLQTTQQIWMRRLCYGRSPWAALQAFTGRRTVPLYPPLDNGTATTPLQKATAFLQQFASVSASHDESSRKWNVVFASEVATYLRLHAADFENLQSDEL